MRRNLTLALTVAAAAACTRDLEIPPKPSVEPLGIIPAFQSVAPRGGMTFVATGGAAPYVFGWAPTGGQLSGADAQLDPSGVYTAGSNGPVRDLVVVTDARGETASATISVGPRIAITPQFTGTVPGGRIAFQATGGDGDYQFTPGTSGSGGSVALDGVYLAGPAGNTVDTVVVTDRHGLGASATAEIQVGPQLQLYRSETRAVAPHESVAFVALGGQPPYTYSIQAKGSGSDAHIDATSGVYVAGTRSADPDPTSVTTDVIQVTDSANQPQHATLAVPVGPRLRLVIGVTDTHPGETVQLAATGGKPPYTFGFAARTSPLAEPNRDRGGNGGNRSGGTVTAVSGEYVPGSSPGAIDFLQVTDSTGAPPDVRQGPPVTGITFAVDRGVALCVAADVNGDLSQDAVLIARGEHGARVVAATSLATQAPVVQTYFMDQRALPAVFANAQQGRNRDSLLVFGGQGLCDAGGCLQPNRDVWALEPDLAGNLSSRLIAGGLPGGTILVPNDPAFGGPANTHWETQSFNLNVGTFVLDPSGAGTAWLYSDGFDSDTLQTTTPFVWPPACPAMAPGDRTILRWSWRPGANGPTGRPECLLVTGGGCPTCVGPRIVAIESGDFNGDGRLDLAYVQTGGNVDYGDATLGAKVYVALGTGGTPSAPAAFVATGHQAWPPNAASGSWRFDFRDQHTQTHLMTVPAPRPLAGGARDTLVVRMIDPAGNPRLFATHDPGAGFSPPFDATGVGGGSAGVARFQSSGGASAVSYDGGSGDVRAFDVTGVASVVPGLSARATLSTMAFGVSAACFPDVNGDGIPDLVAASDLAQTAQLVLGDGTNDAFPAAGQTFGVRAHLRGSEFPIAVGDLDGDGFADVVAASSGAGLDVLWGGGGMLARGARLSTAAVNAVAIGDFGRRTAGGAVVPSVLYQDRTGAFGVVHGDGQGSFDPALAVPAVTADGGAVAPVFLLVTLADLGTSAPGLDLVTGESGATGSFVRAMLYQGSRIVDVKSPALPAGDAQHPTPDQCWTQPVGTGQRTLASICIYDDLSTSNHDRNQVRVFATQVQNPDGGPELPKPTFSSWLAITPLLAPWRSVTPGVRGEVAPAGTLPDGTAVFVLSLDAIYVVEVKLAGDPSLAGSWNVQTFPVAGATDRVMFGTIGKLDQNPATSFHVVAVTEGGMAVLRRDALGYTRTQQLSVSQIPMGIGRLAAGSPGDVVGVVGSFVGSFTGTTEIVPILNLQDGTGRLR